MTEHNLFEEIQEDLQRQKMEALWKKYGPLVLAAAVAIVIATAGITSWRSWKKDHNQEATSTLIELMNQSNADATKQVTVLEEFATKNHGASQATFALLRAAAEAAKEGKLDKALAIYDDVAGDGKTDPAFRQLADLLAVQAQMDKGNAVLLERRLQPLLADNAPWRYSAMEDEGYLALRDGDKAKAQQIFTELSQDASAPQSLSLRAADVLRYVSE